MNLNDIFGPLPQDTPSNDFCNRAKLDTGTYCNYKCVFCYYIDKLDVITPMDVIKQRIDYLVQCEIDEVDLSGGESAIHENWFEILDYCQSKNLKISCLSNGSMFSDMTFLKKSKKHGLTEILFSLHGYDNESHNKIVNNKSAFEKILQAIENCKAIGIKVRVNCTVTKYNYNKLDTVYADLLNQIQPTQVNFLTLNYWDSAKKLQDFSYSLSTPAIKSCIDKIKDNIPNIKVRYTPFCYMTGYEQYVCSTYQHIYDKGDWNIAVYDCKANPTEYIKDKKKVLFDTAFVNRKKSYIKPLACKECKYIYVCDGVERLTDVYPVPGEKIKEIF